MDGKIILEYFEGKNPELEIHIMKKHQEIFDNKSYENFKKNSKMKKISNVYGNLDPYFLFWYLNEDFLIFETWCKRFTNEYNKTLNEIIKKIEELNIEESNIEESNIITKKFSNFENFIKILHNIRKMRNILFHWSGELAVLSPKTTKSTLNKHDKIIGEGLISIFIFEYIFEKIDLFQLKI